MKATNEDVARFMERVSDFGIAVCNLANEMKLSELETATGVWLLNRLTDDFDPEMAKAAAKMGKLSKKMGLEE